MPSKLKASLQVRIVFMIDNSVILVLAFRQQ